MIMPANPLAFDRGSIPFRVVIDFMEGTKRKADAVAFARGFIEHHFDSPADSWYYVQPYPGGYAFEVHEGGPGKAYLPNILETLEVNPTAVLNVPMARRNLQVKKSLNGTYTAILLPEGLGSEEEHVLEAVPSRAMMRLTTTGLGIFTFGSVVFAAGFLAFFSALLMVFLDPAGMFFGVGNNINVKNLPIAQWNRLANTVMDGQRYVHSLTLQGTENWVIDSRQRTLVDESGKTVSPSAMTNGTVANQPSAPMPDRQNKPAPTGNENAAPAPTDDNVPAAPAGAAMQLPVPGRRP